MSVKQQDWKPDQGEKDAKRHRDMVKQEAKKSAIATIVNTPVIGKKGKVSVKIKGKKNYYFRYKEPDIGIGIGQGEGGEVAGNIPGEDWLETEIDIEEIFEWLSEELGLPKLKKKEEGELEVQKGWKTSGLKRTGIPPRLKKKLTVKQAIKRWSGTILGLKRILEEKLGTKPELDDIYYVWAINKVWPDKNKTIELLVKIINGEVTIEKKELDKASIYIDEEDLRYRNIEEDIEHESNAVIIALMDISGSMGEEKKLIARSFYWWSFRMLQQIYRNVEIVFITHHTEAKEVSEKEFFHTMESGGTRCASAYSLATELIQTKYSPDRWNIYVFHFSDGADWDSKLAVKTLKDLLPLANAFGYGETLPWGNDSLLVEYIVNFNLNEEDIDGVSVYVCDDGKVYFTASELEDRGAIWPTIKAFFRKEEEVV